MKKKLYAVITFIAVFVMPVVAQADPNPKRWG